MKIAETSPVVFDALFAAENPCFQTAAFAELNRARCDELRYLLFLDKKVRLGLVLARKGSSWLSPFSAPFGGFVSKTHAPGIELIEAAVDALIAYLEALHAQEFRLTMPPLFYQSGLLTKLQHACTSRGFVVTDWDLNYYFATAWFGQDYVQRRMSRNARRNWSASLENDLQFHALEGEEGLRRAYAVIQGNRQSKGYYLSMRLEEVLTTSKLISTDAFVVSQEGMDLASAIVFHTAPNIVQVVYWGDLAESKPFKAMHFLAYALFAHYHGKGLSIIDVGPAMIDEKPNYGLCEFKESLGCDLQPKLTLVWKPQ